MLSTPSSSSAAAAAATSGQPLQKRMQKRMNKKKKKNSSDIKPAPRRVDVSQFERERDEKRKTDEIICWGKNEQNYQDRMLSSVMVMLKLEVWGEQVKKMQQKRWLAHLPTAVIVSWLKDLRIKK